MNKLKIWLSIVTIMELDQLLELAKFAEQLGFHGVTVGDHLVMPAKIDSKYPYTPDGKVFWPETTPWPDPWIVLSCMGAVTTKLKLASNIYLAALRDPFTAAKALCTASGMTQGRIVCGVSTGWIKEEYEMLGHDFSKRGKRLDEMIVAMRKLWTGQVVSHRGDFFNFDAIMCPPPPSHIPVWCGGGSPGAMRRAARNDGWLPLPMTIEETRAAVPAIRAMRRDTGLSEENFEVILVLREPMSPGAAEAMGEMDIQHNIVIAPWVRSPWEVQSWIDEGDDISRLDVKKKAMERYANAVIAKYC